MRGRPVDDVECRAGLVIRRQELMELNLQGRHESERLGCWESPLDYHGLGRTNAMVICSVGMISGRIREES